MNYLLVALVFLLSMGQLGRIQLGQNLSFYLHDILVFLFLTKVLFELAKHPKKITESLKKNKKFPKKIIFCLMIIIFLSWIVSVINQHLDYRSILYTIRFLAYGFFVYFLQKTTDQQAKPWVITSSLLLLFGFLQYFFVPDLRFISLMGYDDHFYRLSGTLLDPSFLGLILVFALNYQLFRQRPHWLLTIFLTLAIALTYSRAVYATFLLSTALTWYYQKNASWKHKIIILIIGFLAFLPFLPKQSGGAGVDLSRTFTATQRLNNSQAALTSMNMTEWLIGRGLFSPIDRNSSQTITTHAHFPDNFLVFLVSNLGIIGSTLVILLIWKIVQVNNPLQNTLLCSLLIHSMFNHNLTHSFVMLLFWGFFYSRNSTSMARSV